MLRLRGRSATVAIVTTAHFVVPLADLDDGPKQIYWELSEDWLRHALEGSDAEPRGDGSMQLEVSKNGREILVRGSADIKLTMPCVRTLDPVELEIHPEIFLLLEQLPDERVPRRQRGKHPARKKRNAEKKSSTAGSGKWADVPILSNEDAARDAFRGERVELDGFVREFILLELPMAPVRSDLHSAPDTASSPPSADQDAPEHIDPRLAPLAAIASRMRQKEHKE